MCLDCSLTAAEGHWRCNVCGRNRDLWLQPVHAILCHQASAPSLRPVPAVAVARQQDSEEQCFRPLFLPMATLITFHMQTDVIDPKYVGMQSSERESSITGMALRQLPPSSLNLEARGHIKLQSPADLAPGQGESCSRSFPLCPSRWYPAKNHGQAFCPSLFTLHSSQARWLRYNN